MRILKIALFLFIMLIAQTVVFSRVTFFGANIDLFLTIVIVWGLVQGPLEGFWLGLMCGFLADIFSFQAVSSTITLAITGLMFGMLRGRIFKDELFVVFMCVFGGTFISYLIGSWVLFYFYQKNLSDFIFIAFLSSILNLLIVPAVSKAVYKLNNHENQF